MRWELEHCEDEGCPPSPHPPTCTCDEFLIDLPPATCFLPLAGIDCPAIITDDEAVPVTLHGRSTRQDAEGFEGRFRAVCDGVELVNELLDPGEYVFDFSACAPGDLMELSYETSDSCGTATASCAFVMPVTAVCTVPTGMLTCDPGLPPDFENYALTMELVDGGTVPVSGTYRIECPLGTVVTNGFVTPPETVVVDLIALGCGGDQAHIFYNGSDLCGTAATKSCSVWVPVPGNLPPIATSIEDQEMDQYTPVTLDVGGSFSDPEGDTMSFTIAGLPSGLMMDAAGVVTGFAGAGSAFLSPHHVVVTANDGSGNVVSNAFDIHVNAVELRSDLRTTISTLTPVVSFGDMVSVEIVVENAGPHVTPAIMRTPLPSEMLYSAAAADIGTIQHYPGAGVNGETVWNIASLAPGETATITVLYQVNITSGVIVASTNEATGPNADPTTTGNPFVSFTVS